MTDRIIAAIKHRLAPISRRPVNDSLAREAGEGWGEGTSRLLITFLLAVVLAPASHPAPSAAQSVPRISVVFVKPANFTDVGYSEGERGSRAILLQLQRFIIDTAARYLPEEMLLEIKITDIDLAGDFELFRGPQFDHVRVNKSIYPPRIALEFRVAGADDQTIKEGARTLTDLDYQLRVVYPREDYLRHEKELLRDWLRTEFGTLNSARTN